jgi:hypothetical protein
LGWVEVLEKGVEEQLAKGIWMGWFGWEEFRWGTAAAVRCRVEEERAKQLKGERV